VKSFSSDKFLPLAARRADQFNAGGYVPSDAKEKSSVACLDIRRWAVLYSSMGTAISPRGAS
jgi:hypothetical protein